MNKMWIVNEVSEDGGVKIDDPFKGIYDSVDQAIDYVLTSINHKLGDDYPLIKESSEKDDLGEVALLEYRASPGLKLQILQVEVGSVDLKLTITQAKVLYEKLDRLLAECFIGVDVWLAPGGYLNVNEGDKDSEVFLTPDPTDDSISLDAIHSMLKGHLKITTHDV